MREFFGCLIVGIFMTWVITVLIPAEIDAWSARRSQAPVTRKPRGPRNC